MQSRPRTSCGGSSTKVAGCQQKAIPPALLPARRLFLSVCRRAQHFQEKPQHEPDARHLLSASAGFLSKIDRNACDSRLADQTTPYCSNYAKVNKFRAAAIPRRVNLPQVFDESVTNITSLRLGDTHKRSLHWPEKYVPPPFAAYGRSKTVRQASLDKSDRVWRTQLALSRDPPHFWRNKAIIAGT